MYGHTVEEDVLDAFVGCRKIGRIRAATKAVLAEVNNVFLSHSMLGVHALTDCASIYRL